MINFNVEFLRGDAVFPNSISIGTVEYPKDYQEGTWLLLFFYPADFTWVCPTELRELKNRFSEFKELNTEIWGISTDGIEVHKKWVHEEFGGLPFLLVSDRSWQISEDFRCMDSSEGVCYRCTVLIDDAGLVRHYSVNDNNVGRNIDEILRLIKAFQESDVSDGQVAPCGWTPGEEMITPGE